MRSVAVFLSCQEIKNPVYLSAAEELGRCMAAKNIQLIYGGSSLGLMGNLARALLEKNGKVIGILTHHLREKELEQDGLSQLIFVDDIAQRLRCMRELADAFIAFPGGLGTMEELFNAWNEIRLGLCNKKLGLLNINGYYTPFLEFIAHMHEHGFVSLENKEKLIVAQQVETLLDLIF
ncbi:LOG family protein [Legionella jordanis]|uniref:Cytokinin riboside 5'-monophosphate phosphoribohydrolase n=1 Tax=Legionella jordanis TaxID=456 RepID=A0A0W0VBU2_9GAMM|nr:TIGR00730 family Rossman fold protein [Legionella jordanis]KTD17584.1 lysine decarboxylase [Legionella jordanis]RMX00867.1 TIGR00730 family Rossman fold protein [Legionella jordanis]VEH11494.1 lysine decarboxylase [Legionella jordanis]